MDRNTYSRTNGPDFGPRLVLLASAAMASMTLAGCTTAAAPPAQISYGKAQVALEKGEASQAKAHAEAAVLGDPRNPAYRALLGTAYLEVGRYNSAAASFGDALELGDRDPRTVLSYVLTATAIGEGKAALAELREWESALDPADAGLALALAGNPERGVFVLTNALRSGQNSAKMRQNLAYTYALAGNWRAARVMAAEDVPADQLDARLSDWATKARPEDSMLRISSLLGINPVSDGGLPATLALSNFPSTQQMMADAQTRVDTDAAPAQIAAAPGKPSQSEALAFGVGAGAMGADNDTVESVDPTVERIMAATGAAPRPVAAPTSAATPRTSSKTVEPAGPRFVSRPVVQDLPQAAGAAPVAAAPQSTPQAAPTPAQAPAPQRVAAAPSGDTHLVQLGSYPSEDDARRGWTALKQSFPQLSAHDVVITKAEVKGKTYYRVAAAGFGRQSAAQLCSSVKSAGRGCFAYSKTNPPAGAVAEGIRIAAK